MSSSSSNKYFLNSGLILIQGRVCVCGGGGGGMCVGVEEPGTLGFHIPPQCFTVILLIIFDCRYFLVYNNYIGYILWAAITLVFVWSGAQREKCNLCSSRVFF